MSRGTEPVLSGMSGKISHYRLDGYIGRGGIAVVYLAQDERQDRTVALKVLAPDLARDAAFRTRFLHESRAAAAVNHPHIIPVYEADDSDGNLYVAMRYVQGGDARSLLGRLGQLPLGWAWSIIAQVASALDAAHAHGLIHRDVKPGNMLLDIGSAAGPTTPRRPDGGDFDHVYLSDFGISKSSPPADGAATVQFTGAADYVAPEQVEGSAVDGRADLYSLACAGFELLCGTPPFGQDQGLTVMYAQLYAPPPMASARRPDLPAAVDRVLATALAKNPADRYATCAQFAAELHAALGLLSGESGTPAPMPAPDNAAPAAPEPGLASGAPGPDRGLGKNREEAGSRQAGETREIGETQEIREAGQAREIDRREFGYGPGAAPVPVLHGPGWPPPAEGQPPAGPDRSAGLIGGTGRIYPVRTRQHPGRLRLILGAAAAVVVVAVAVAISLSRSSAPGTSNSPGASSAPASSAVASRQAAAVNDLLGSSAAARNGLEGAIRKVRNCAHLPSAVSRIRAVVNQRRTELAHATALPTSALAHGAIVKSDLLAALRHSLDADRDYLAWARQQRNSGCRPAARSGAYRAALNADGQADTSKGAFVRVWNPIAARYGIPHKTPADI